MALVTMKKQNRVLKIDEAQLKSYLNRGYDQINDDGKVVKHATGGRTVPVAELNAALEKIEELKGNAKGDVVSKEEFDNLQAEFQKLSEEHNELKLKAQDFAEKGKTLKKENDELKSKLNNKK